MRNLLLFLFIIINAFLYVLNFELFNSQVNMDFGFGVYNTMPILFVIIIGLLFLIFYVITGNYNENKNKSLVNNLESKIALLEKDLEIKDLKHQVETKDVVLEHTETIETDTN